MEHLVHPNFRIIVMAAGHGWGKGKDIREASDNMYNIGRISRRVKPTHIYIAHEDTKVDDFNMSWPKSFPPVCLLRPKD